MSRFLISLLLLVPLGFCFGCGQQSVAEHTTTVVQTVASSTSQSPVRAVRPRPRIAFERYQADSYAARVPKGWTVEADQARHQGYVESKWRDPEDPNVSLTIDASEGQSMSAVDKADEVRNAVANEASYSEQSFAATTFGAYGDAFEWVFRLSGDKRVDYFLHECGTGVAILGSTSPRRFAEVQASFRRVAASLAIECAQEVSTPPPTPPSSAGPSSPPDSSEANFCATHDCIPSFDEGTGDIVQCADGEWSHSGGRPGACSYHGGETGGTGP